jgi:3-dehydroquinate dehydratase / shikimate dehydrogenase
MARSALHDRVRRRRNEIGRASEAAISVTVAATPDATELASLAGSARYLEVRADLAGDLDAGSLRQSFEGGLVYSLRSAARGGRSESSISARRRRLIAAAEAYDLVDLEYPHDLAAGLLERIPPARRRISWHGPAADTPALRARFEQMAETPARLYLLAAVAESIADGLAPLRLLGSLGRTDVTAFATGQAGTWSRLLAPRLGARVVYARLRESPEPGPPTVDRLSADYGLPMMGSLRDLYGIVGGSVASSLAPRIYNKGFRALALPALCLPFSTAEFDVFWSELVERGLAELGVALRGLTVVTPHKERALATSTLATDRAREAGAANSLVRAGQAWQGATTTTVLAPLARAGIDPAGRTAAVVGCGGAGRSVAVELRRRGTAVTLVNRGKPRATYASELLGLPWTPLAEFAPGAFDLIINATPLSTESPFDVSRLARGTAVVDLPYRADGDTALVAAARGRGLAAVDGRAVLASETGGQFELMTGQPMPPDAVEIASVGG